MADFPIQGSCLCGAVRYELTGHQGVFQYCHCSRCRKFTGSSHGANLIAAPDQFRWLDGEGLVGRFEHPEAKHFATSFCSRCGSSLPWRTKSGKAVIVPAGTLDGVPDIRPLQNLFWGSRADWFVDPAELPHHDTLPGR